MGAAYGTAKSGVGIASMGVMRPELVMKSIVPVVMAGVLGIYGLIIAVIISTGSKFPSYLRNTISCDLACRLIPANCALADLFCACFAVNSNYTLFDGYAHLASGLSCGLAGLAAGMAIGIVGDAGVRYEPCRCY